MIQIEIERHKVTVKFGGKILHPNITSKEFELLRYLAATKGRVQSRAQILEKAWGHAKGTGVDTRTVDQHIMRLRKKLGPGAACIVTVSNYGYYGQDIKLVEPEPPCVLRFLEVTHNVDKKSGQSWTEARVRFDKVVPDLKKGDERHVTGAVA